MTKKLEIEHMDGLPGERAIAVIYGKPSELPEHLAMITGVDDQPEDDFLIPGEDDRKSQEFDIVQKAKHYNSHPSGVECIELAELMNFNTGNAFKYVFRRGDKGNVRQDLEKAAWYTSREIDRLTALLKYVPVYVLRKYSANNTFTEVDRAKARQVVRMEPDYKVSLIYESLLSCQPVREYRISLLQVAGAIEKLLENIE